MSTVVIQIGNSDDKLTQFEWSNFCNAMKRHVQTFTAQIHFHGCSENSLPWQNACWVVSIERQLVYDFTKGITDIRTAFGQDSAAVTIGETEFI